MDNLNFADIDFKGLTRDILFSETSGIKLIIPVNAELIVKAHDDAGFHKLLMDNYTTFDGQVPYIIARLKNPDARFEKIAGSDFIYDICEYSKKYNKKVFLLGGYEESNTGAIRNLKERYGIEIGGFSPKPLPYPFPADHDEEILKRIRDFRPDFLCVGFGAPKQELWMSQHRDALNNIGVRWAVGVGGSFDFASGFKSRAPVFIQKLGIEGLYRLIVEPKFFRLKRLYVSLKVFKYI